MKSKYIFYIIIIGIVALCAIKFLDYLETKSRNDRIIELDREIRKSEKDIDTLNDYLDMTDR